MEILGLGTAAIGRPHYINIRQEPAGAFELETFKRQGKSVLDAAWELGIRYFDTAPGYGIAEQMIREWVQENPEKGVEIATKWGYTYTANFDLNAPVHEVKEHSLIKLDEQWEASKELLPRLTTYQIHSATFESGVLENQEVLLRLRELKQEHSLKMGLSVSGANQVEILKRALEISSQGELLFDVVQVTFNMLEQSLLQLLDQLHALDRRIIIKEALANGRIFPNPRYPHYQPLYQTLEGLARKYEVGVDAVALRYCADRLRPYQVLSGAATVQQLQENALMNRFELTGEEIAELSGFGISSEAYWSERKQLGWN